MSMPELPEGLEWRVQRVDWDIEITVWDKRFSMGNTTLKRFNFAREDEIVKAVESAADRLWRDLLHEHQVDCWIEKNWGTK